MTLIQVATILVGCLLASSGAGECVKEKVVHYQSGAVAGVAQGTEDIPQKTSEAIDVVLSAKAALVWDEKTGTVLYEKNAREKRPVASLSKLLTALVVRENMLLKSVVEIPSEVKIAQRRGANIKLPVGDEAGVYDLLSAGLIASANDAMVALAISMSGSESEFVETANKFAAKNGAFSTKISNATGLGGGEQYSTAHDIKELFSLAYRDKVIRDLLVSENGVLTTESGVSLEYKSTNKLFGTYFPVLAAKTGYTVEAGENLVVMTYGDRGQRIGAVILGSEARFQDMKTLVEWVWRSYTWP
jgi:D-alanyl-D-alanine carboxypeptidase (penicillin-binding protein 5/6)